MEFDSLIKLQKKRHVVQERVR